MLPGIACGIKKILLIFNTFLNSPPIYVVDPSNFGVKPDTNIPIILAYNMAHYESMEPCSNTDILASINLVKEYQEGRCRFSRGDLPFLFGLKEQEGCIKRKHEFTEQAQNVKPLKIDEQKKGKKTKSFNNSFSFDDQIVSHKTASESRNKKTILLTKKIPNKTNNFVTYCSDQQRRSIFQ